MVVDFNIRSFWSKKILDLPAPGSMSSTNSANPLACSAGLATLKEFKAKNIVKIQRE